MVVYKYTGIINVTDGVAAVLGLFPPLFNVFSFGTGI